MLTVYSQTVYSYNDFFMPGCINKILQVVRRTSWIQVTRSFWLITNMILIKYWRPTTGWSPSFTRPGALFARKISAYISAVCSKKTTVFFVCSGWRGKHRGQIFIDIFPLFFLWARFISKRLDGEPGLLELSEKQLVEFIDETSW